MNALGRIGLLGLWAMPSAAWACSSCFDPKDASNDAFLGSTVFLSLLPLLMMAGVGAYVFWRVRAATPGGRGAASQPLIVQDSR